MRVGGRCEEQRGGARAGGAGGGAARRRTDIAAMRIAEKNRVAPSAAVAASASASSSAYPPRRRARRGAARSPSAARSSAHADAPPLRRWRRWRRAVVRRRRTTVRSVSSARKPPVRGESAWDELRRRVARRIARQFTAAAEDGVAERRGRGGRRRLEQRLERLGAAAGFAVVEARGGPHAPARVLHPPPVLDGHAGERLEQRELRAAHRREEAPRRLELRRRLRDGAEAAHERHHVDVAVERRVARERGARERRRGVVRGDRRRRGRGGRRARRRDAGAEVAEVDVGELHRERDWALRRRSSGFPGWSAS